MAAALVRIAAQPEQIYENKEERFKKWSKDWLRKQSMSGEPATSACFPVIPVLHVS